MDRNTLRQRLSAFLALGRQEGKPFEIVRIDDAIPGIAADTFILRIVAPWAANSSWYEATDELLALLWRSTDVETRRAIFALNVRPTAADIISEAQAQAVWAS